MKHVRNDIGASKLALSLSVISFLLCIEICLRACTSRLRVNENPAVIELLTV